MIGPSYYPPNWSERAFRARYDDASLPVCKYCHTEFEPEDNDEMCHDCHTTCPGCGSRFVPAGDEDADMCNACWAKQTKDTTL